MASRLTYFVCATPRSGSTLLQAIAPPASRKPEEYFERLRHSGLPRERRFVSSYAPSVRHVLDHLGVSADHIPDPLLSHPGDDRLARFKEAA